MIELTGSLAVGDLGEEDDLVTSHNNDFPHKEPTDEIRKSNFWDFFLYD